MARCPTCHRRLIPGQTCPVHGAHASSISQHVTPPPPSATARRPDWTRPLGERIGSGGFASVWAIADGSGVLKVAHADHDLARARLAREAEALAAIGAPAVPRLDDHGVLPDGRAWIAMERIEGALLSDLLTAPLRVDRAVAIALAILDALAKVHAAGFVHRDLKPDNLVRRADDSICILDLGLARKLPTDLDDPTRAGVQVGSLEYLPPEQLVDAASVDQRADLYAFGCILYELCAGRPPFLGDAAALERAHAALRPPPLGALAAVPAALEALCHDCLAKLPARRPPDVAQVRARLSVRGEPSLGRTHPTSVISEGKQPVVLVWAELPRVDRALLGVLAARKIAVISQRGRRVLGGVVGAEHADPAAAAIAAARDLSAAGARVVLHLELMHVTPRIMGSAADKPEDWLPASPWKGVLLTRALATVAQVPTRAAYEPELGPGFVRLAEAGEATELFGRDAHLADLAADAAAALGGAGPALAVILGDPGVGKSALAAALVPRLHELGARVYQGTVPPPGIGRPGWSALESLVGTPQGPIVRAVGDAIRAAARAQPTAILLDNVHLAEHELLDALEYATLGGEPLKLWVLALATPRLDQRRPGFGERAERRRREILPPLDEDAAVAMTAALLRPAEYPPLRALRQIATLARGNPMHLSGLAREIHDRGAIRTRPNGEHFLDTTALDALPPLALGPWLAARELAGLGPELVALARLCAVLGDVVARDELAAVVELVERRGGATTDVDVDIGLAELAEVGVLAAGEGGWAFRQTLLQEGIYATTNEDERRVLHAAALDYWRRHTDDPAAPGRIARHAEAVGDRRVAADAFAQLGAAARRHHAVLEADQAWSGALRNLPERNLERARALLGRARAREQLQRIRESLEDLDEALAIAVRERDVDLETAVLLEQATALDHVEEFTRSKAVVARARSLEDARPGPSRFALAIDFAEARSVHREGKNAEAAPRLRDVRAAAHAVGDTETEIDAGVLLVPALVDLGELDEAEAAFDSVVSLCEARDDRFHVAALYINRAWLWSARGEVDREADDLGIVIQLAREAGQGFLERAATYNLAEARLWEGLASDALALARRSLALQSMHGEATTRRDRTLLARIHAAVGDVPALAAMLSILRSDQLPPEDEEDLPTLAVLEALAKRGEDGDWESALGQGDHLPAPHRLELALLASRHGHLHGRRREEMRGLASAHPMWAQRLDEF